MIFLYKIFTIQWTISDFSVRHVNILIILLWKKMLIDIRTLLFTILHIVILKKNKFICLQIQIRYWSRSTRSMCTLTCWHSKNTWTVASTGAPPFTKHVELLHPGEIQGNLKNHSEDSTENNSVNYYNWMIYLISNKGPGLTVNEKLQRIPL